MVTYEKSDLAVRTDIIQVHNLAWSRIARAGTWLDGATRVAIAAETRHAPQCALCRRRKEALSPYSEAGEHDSVGALPERVVEQIHRIVSDPGDSRGNGSMVLSPPVLPTLNMSRFSV